MLRVLKDALKITGFSRTCPIWLVEKSEILLFHISNCYIHCIWSWNYFEISICVIPEKSRKKMSQFEIFLTSFCGELQFQWSLILVSFWNNVSRLVALYLLNEESCSYISFKNDTSENHVEEIFGLCAKRVGDSTKDCYFSWFCYGSWNVFVNTSEGNCYFIFMFDFIPLIALIIKQSSQPS